MNQLIDILVVDDEQVIIDSVIKISKMENLTIKSALDAETALEKLEQNQYKIILSDIMMPGMDGFAFLKEISLRKIKSAVILTTGYSTLENAVKALTRGATAFIPKPFSIDELLSVVNRGLRYTEIMKDSVEKNRPLVFVSCPSRFLRLGFSSWLNDKYDGTVLLGSTDLYLKLTGSIERIEFLNSGDHLSQGSECVKFIAEDGLNHNIYSSVSGRILEVNNKLLENPKIIEKDPYFEGWIYRILPSDLENEKSKLIACSSDPL